ncbi:MAG: phosphoribosylformylglycinamidine synthase subunit PurQ, partial [Cytophagales bacterium]
MKPEIGSTLLYIDFSKDDLKLGGSSLGQVLSSLGNDAPTIKDSNYFVKAFATVQELVHQNLILAGHDISSGGLITTLLEMCFPNQQVGINLTYNLGNDQVKTLFAENPGVVMQVSDVNAASKLLTNNDIHFQIIGKVNSARVIEVEGFRLPVANNQQPATGNLKLDIDSLRSTWFHTSYLLDKIQRSKSHAEKRKENFTQQPLTYQFPIHFDGTFKSLSIDAKRRTPSGIKAAIIREKGVNGDREMAYALYLAGFDVKDVHMTDLVSGREDLSGVNMIVFVGGFSNSDVLGSAKGWAGAFLYNPKAKQALDAFYARRDTLSLGVCNGCQLMIELGLITPEHI